MKNLDDLAIELFVTIADKDDAAVKSDKETNPNVTELEREDWYRTKKQLAKKETKLLSEIAKLEGTIPEKSSERTARNHAVSTYLARAFLKAHPYGVFSKRYDNRPHFYGFLEKYTEAGRDEQFIEIDGVTIDIDEVVEQEYVKAGFYGQPTKKVKNFALKSAFSKAKREMKTNS